MVFSKSQVPVGFSQLVSQSNKFFNTPELLQKMYQYRTTKLWISPAKLKKADKKLVDEIVRISEALSVKVLETSSELIKLQPIKVKNRYKNLIFGIYISYFDDPDRILLDFRLFKGCGLDFRRHFISISAALKKLEDRDMKNIQV